MQMTRYFTATNVNTCIFLFMCFIEQNNKTFNVKNIGEEERDSDIHMFTT